MVNTRTIIFFMLLSIAGSSQAEDVSKLEGWELWDKIIGTDQKEWKLVKKKKGITTWVRPVEISPVKSFKGIIEFDTSVGALTALLFDTENLPNWMRLTNAAEVIKQPSKTEVYRHTINKPMWPVRPRDCCSLMKGYYYPETGTVMLRYIHTPDLLPRNKKYIRMPVMIGYYMIKPKPNGKVEFTFESVVEMAGWIPTWIINFYIADVPIGTFESILDIMPLDKYKNHKYDFEKDFVVVK